MKSYYSTAIEYNRFMEAFKRVYPALYQKCRGNISIPHYGCNRVGIQTTPQLRKTSKAILTHIINEYYRPLSN